MMLDCKYLMMFIYNLILLDYVLYNLRMFDDVGYILLMFDII